MNSFQTIKSNVATRVGDTSSTFLTIIGGYINQRYERLFKKFNFETIKTSYSFSTVAGTADYTLETGFGKELYVFDDTNKLDIIPSTLQGIERDYPSSLSDSGQPYQYAVYKTLDSSSPANIITKIRFYPNPSSIITVLMPYIKAKNDLSSNTDLPIIEMSDLAIELGATADAWRTKRQFAKAADFETQYEQIISEMIWSQDNQPNRITQFVPKTYDRNLLY